MGLQVDGGHAADCRKGCGRGAASTQARLLALRRRGGARDANRLRSARHLRAPGIDQPAVQPISALGINARLSLFIGLVEFYRLLGPQARVARCLASLFDPALYPRTGSCVDLNQEEIGLLSAVSRQRTNEALHQLERDGLLRVAFGSVTVLDLPALRGYSAARPASRRRGP